jgi:hypothetical protein
MTEILKNPHIPEMLTVANEFCHLTENIEHYEKEQIITVYQKMCALLYLKGCLLPPFSTEEKDAIERFVTEEQWEIIRQAIKKKFDTQDTFKYFDDGEIKTSEISEQLSDIYQDMKDFILLYKKSISVSQEAAVSEIIRLFKSHWGIKCIILTKVFHKIINE